MKGLKQILNFIVEVGSTKIQKKFANKFKKIKNTKKEKINLFYC